MKQSAFRQPINMLVLINMLAFGLLFFYRDPLNYNTLIVGGTILVLSVITYCILYFRRLGDAYLFLIASMLVTLGVMMLCRLNYDRGMKQVWWYVISVVAFYVTFFTYKRISFLPKLKWTYLGLSVALFLVTLAFGTSIKGARNWIVIAGRTFQPSEFIKILFVFFLSCYFASDRKGTIKGVPERYVITACVYIFLGFLVLQREWGIAVLLFVVFMAMEYIFEHNWLLLLGNTFLAAISAALGVLTMYHIQVRISNWIDPWTDIANKGYQITQSLFAIAAGGFFGRGIGLGNPELIPEVHSDFIFSAICEEMGIFGGVAIILLYFIFVYRGFKITLTLPEGFDKCVATGITVMFAIQSFIIIGGVIKLIPLTGITMPFVSYGGSSLLSSFVALGILQAISTKGVIQ